MTIRPDRSIGIPAAARGARTTIGLDFGTHSTKIVLGVRNQERKHAIVLDHAAEGYPTFASPSLIRWTSSGRLLFGASALADDSGKLYRSLKVTLLPPDSPAITSVQDEPSADLLVAAYIGWLLSRLRDAFGPKPSLAMNVAAPMNSVQGGCLQDRYLHVIQAAWLSAFGSEPILIRQGVRLADIRTPLTELLGRPVPPIDERPFEVKPETFAPLVSLRQDPRLRPGFYLVVDMGAGTTEVSVTHLAGSEPDHGLICYEDESHVLGGDDYEREPERVPEWNDRLELLIRRVWHGAYMRDANGTRVQREAFRRLCVRFAGGGLRRQGLSDFVNGLVPPRWVFHLRDVECEWGVWHDPINLDGVEGPDRPLLAVADGLAVERQLWPNYVTPFQVPHSRHERFVDPFEVPYYLY